MRLGLSLLLGSLVAAAGEHQIDWVADFDKAFELAKERKCPVMVCINSKDREKASRAMQAMMQMKKIDIAELQRAVRAAPKKKARATRARSAGARR